MSLTSRRRVVVPDPKELRERRNRLPKFKPLELDELAKRSRADDDLGDDFGRLVRILQRETDRQMFELLRRFGIDVAQPDAWRKGFFRLACYHHGVGRFGYYRPKKHRNAATWTTDQDLTLLRRAIQELAEDGRVCGAHAANEGAVGETQGPAG